MTILGKILVFVVLVLALIWNALVVNAYVTRANWKAELTKAQAKLTEAGDAASNERTRADRSREAADAVIGQLQKEIERLGNERTTLTANLTDAQNKLAEAQKNEGNVATRDVVAQANVKRVQDQVDILQKQLDASEKKNNDLTIAAERSKMEAQQAKINEDSAKRRADELESIVLKMKDPNKGAGGVGSIRPQVDKDFRATVTSVDGDTVVISLGANARVQKGALLSISRFKPEAKYVGSLTITSVDPFYAVGRFSPPANVAKPGPNDMPKAGDTVSVID